MKIIAKQSDLFVLEYIDKDFGRVVDFKKNIIYSNFPILSILARGYWEEYPEPIDFTPPTNLSGMIMKDIKGGQGSGNFAHAGRPGAVGGSGEGVSGFPKDAKDITSEQAMKQANYQDIKARMKKNLSEIRQGESNQIEVKGQINSRAASDIEKNMKAELSLYGNYLAGDTMSTARDYIDDFREVINKGINDGSLKDIKADDLNKLGIDNVNKLLHQERESNRQQFTDHGIRHIVGDVLRQRQIMKEMNPDITAKELLMGDFVMINHDIGYTVPLIREGGERGISMTKQHPLFSQKITEEQRDIWNKDKIFSTDEYSKMTEVIRTHDSTKISNKDILSTSSRLSDNLSLFSKEKLPSVFKYVSGGDTYLINMGIAAAKKDSVAFEKHKKDLYQKIDDSNISTSLKRDLKSATKEIGYLTPKFTLGVLAGEINSIKKESGRINISIKYNSYDAKMQKLFDMGQKQTKKFLEDNGVTDFSKTKYNLGDMLSLEVKGYEEKKSLFDITYKHLQGQHDQSTHAGDRANYQSSAKKRNQFIKDMIEKIKSGGGLTWDFKTKKDIREGYVVGAFPNRSLVFDIKSEEIKKNIKSWLEKNQKILQDKKIKVGAWLDTDTNKIWLDVVRIYPDKKDLDLAKRIGAKKNQIAITNLWALTSGDMGNAFISTGGTGEFLKGVNKGEGVYLLFDNNVSSEEIISAIQKHIKIEVKLFDIVYKDSISFEKSKVEGD